jgi:hypothetical protein
MPVKMLPTNSGYYRETVFLCNTTYLNAVEDVRKRGIPVWKYGWDLVYRPKHRRNSYGIVTVQPDVFHFTFLEESASPGVPVGLAQTLISFVKASLNQ